MYLAAPILGAAAGIALLAATILEVTGRMVSLIPKAWNRAKREGRAEQRKPTDGAYKRFGIEVDGIFMLPRTPEVERFLAGDGEDHSRRCSRDVLGVASRHWTGRLSGKLDAFQNLI